MTAKGGDAVLSISPFCSQLELENGGEERCRCMPLALRPSRVASGEEKPYLSPPVSVHRLNNRDSTTPARNAKLRTVG